MEHFFLKVPGYLSSRRILLGGGILILLAITSLIYSCQKSYDSTEPLNTRLHFREGGTTVSNGMLKFESMEAVDSYLESVDLYRSYHYTDDDSDQLLSDVDPGVNTVEDNMEFLCLSSLYDSLEYLDDEFRNSPRSTVDIYIGDPELQLLLNREHEVWIEDTIYKVVADHYYYKIRDADLSVLNSIRSDPEYPTINTNTNLEYFDPNLGGIKFRSGCHAEFRFLTAPSVAGDFVNVLIEIFIVNSSGETHACTGSSVEVDWGDGSTHSTGIINFPQSHAYEIEPTETETFNITVTLDVNESSLCGDCSEIEFETTNPITLSNGSCMNSNNDQIILEDHFFSAGGHDWKVSGSGGYKSTSQFLNRAKVFGELYLFRKKNDNSYTRKKPDIKASTRTFGSVFDYFDCLEDEDDFDESKVQRDNRVYVHYSKNGRLSVQDELSDEPKFDYKVYITSATIPNASFTSIELFP